MVGNQSEKYRGWKPLQQSWLKTTPTVVGNQSEKYRGWKPLQQRLEADPKNIAVGNHSNNGRGSGNRTTIHGKMFSDL